jgi:nicotinamidase-related amidase
VTGYTAPVWERSALLVIDLQCDFLDDGAAAVPGTSAVVDAVAEIAEAFRSANRPIVHLVRLYVPGGTDVDLPRRDAVGQGARIVAPGSQGSQVPDAVLRQPTDLDPTTLLAGEPQEIADLEVVLYKPRWSAFHRTSLEEWLRDRGCDTVVVAGCNLPNCPRATLFDASERDFRTVLVHDAVSQVSDERLFDLERIGVNVLTVEDAHKALAALGY